MKLIASLAALFLAIYCQAQVVDKTRLEYFEEKLASPQVGMCISSDGKLGAFLFDNNKLNVFDLQRSHLVKSLDIKFTDLGEIRFNQSATEIILIERNRVRSLDWRLENVKMDETFAEEVVAGDLSKDDKLAIASLNKVDIWDMGKHTHLNSFEVKFNIVSVALSPKDKHLVINPRMNLLGSKLYIYDYESGRVLQTFNKYFQATYNETGDMLYAQRMVRIRHRGGSIGVVGVFEVPLVNPKPENTKVISVSYEKNDIGAMFAMLPMEGKLVGTGGYRGFKVYNTSEGGRVFTTMKTRRDRSASNFTPYQNYNGKPAYKLNEDRALVNAYGDNINQIYSARQNEIIGYLFADGNGDLATVSRDGKFDGSTEASTKLYWSARNSSKKTSLESTFSLGFTPNLLAMLVDSDLDVSEFDIDAEIAAIPEIRISTFDQQQVKAGTSALLSDQKIATIIVEVTSNLREVSQVKLFQNSKVVGVRENPSERNVVFEVSLTNSAGEDNYFYATATGVNGIDSEKQKLTVSYTGKTDAKPKLFLVTIGINEYRNPKYNLNYAIADADAFEGALSSGASSVFESIQNLRIRNTQFTKEGILEAMEAVQRDSKEQDMLVFYYAGHGVMSQDEQDADFYLVPHDVTQLYGRDDMLRQRAVSAAELKDLSRKINAQKQVFILDACQSAAALDAVTQRGAAEERAIAQLARSTGTFWITATGSEQFATEFESLGHGVFTYALVEGLTGKADGGSIDNKVTVRELNAYLESRVPELAEEYKGTPQFPSGYSFGNDFPLVVYDR